MRRIELPKTYFDGYYNDGYYKKNALILGLSFGPDAQALAILLGLDGHLTCDRNRCYDVFWWDLRSDFPTGRERGGRDNCGVWADPVLTPDHRLFARADHQDTAGVDWITLIDRAGRPGGNYHLAWPSGCSLSALAFSAGGRSLVAAAREFDASGFGEEQFERNGIFLWDLDELFGRLTREMFASRGASPHLLTPLEDSARPYCLAFSPDGRELAAGLDRGVVARGEYSAEHWLPRRTAEVHKRRPARKLAFSPDGRTLAAAVGKAVLLFEAGAVRPRAKLGGHGRPVRDLAFHPDGRLLATACGDDNVYLWDTAKGSLQKYDWKVGPVTAVAFSPDGCVGAAGGSKGAIALWDVDV